MQEMPMCPEGPGPGVGDTLTPAIIPWRFLAQSVLRLDRSEVQLGHLGGGPLPENVPVFAISHLQG